jgi:hypothetical protein
MQFRFVVVDPAELIGLVGAHRRGPRLRRVASTQTRLSRTSHPRSVQPDRATHGFKFDGGHERA